MNAKTYAWTLGAALSGMVVGFIAATFGAGTNIAQITQQRDELRDRLTDQVKLALDTGAEMVKAERKLRKEAEDLLQKRIPKVVKGGA